VSEQRILEELKAIKGNKPAIDPEDVVAFAADETTALHSRFEWDDSKAGHQYRVWQARHILSVYVTVVDDGGNKAPMRMFAVLREQDGGSTGYRTTEDVLNDPLERAELLLGLLRRLDGMLKSYPLAELEPIRKAIDRCRKAAKPKLQAAE
jgi:hypothetical protein